MCLAKAPISLDNNLIGKHLIHSLKIDQSKQEMDLPQNFLNKNVRIEKLEIMLWGREKGDWDFRISDLVKNPDGTDI